MTDPAQQPRTGAGRDWLRNREQYEIWHRIDGRRDETLRAILAIEAEAAAHERANRREQVYRKQQTHRILTERVAAALPGVEELAEALRLMFPLPKYETADWYKENAKVLLEALAERRSAQREEPPFRSRPKIGPSNEYPRWKP